MGATYISAGAGSGKTYLLTHMLADRMVPKEPDAVSVDASGIILTTFTKSAAADFIRKAREVLIDKKNRPDKAAELDGALIGTVHSICERFIRKYWFELGLTLPLNVLSDVDKKLYMSRIAEIAAGEDDILFFSEFAREFSMNEDFWKQSIAEIINKKYSFGIEDFSESRQASLEFIDSVFHGDTPNPEEITEQVVPFLEALLDFVKTDNLNKGIVDESKTGMKRQRSLERVLSDAASVLEKTNLILSNVDTKKKSIFIQDYWKDMIEKRGIDPEEIAGIAERYVLSKEIGNRLKECTVKLFDLAETWEKEYDRFKKENGLLDFNDMEQRFIRLLTEERFEHVRKDIGDTYKVMMVDEFQDSNPVQIRIFRQLMELVDETVFVGDSKQAIYGFRGTESSLVDDFIRQRIPSKESLKVSYRSRPELVRAANDIFCHAWGVSKQEPDPDNPTAPYDGLSLHPDRNTHDGQDPALQHWNAPLKSPRATKLDYLTIGRKIRKIVEDKTCKVVRKVKNKKTGKEEEILDSIRYGDIAILLRNGTSTGDIAQKLREAGVPVSIQETEFIGWAEVQLVLSLIRYVINPEDRCAKADILHLIGGMSTEDIIINAAAGREDPLSSLSAWLKDLRSRVSVLSVSEIVDSLALELDIYGNSAPWGLSETRIRNLDFLASVAREYEQLCANMNAAPTLPGFIAYVSDYKTEGHKVDRADTVKVLTCHSAKGLEWPMVILDELDSLDLSDQEIAQKEVRGVHSFRKEKDSQVRLLVFPEIFYKKSDRFQSSQSIPNPIVEKMKKTEYFKKSKDRKIAEERNLLYVAFTRARDYLVTLGYWIKSKDKKKPDKKSKYSWLTNCGAAAWKPDYDTPVPNENGFALWHSKHASSFFDLPIQDAPEQQENSQPQAWAVPKEKKREDKFKSPSSSGPQKSDSQPAGEKKYGNVHLSEVFRGEKMMQDIKEDSARCGTCIHRIFAAYDPDADRKEMEETARRIIEGMELTAEFPSPESVIDSAAQLFDWLKSKYGEGTAHHELPVLMKQPDGTVIRGEMDLVWALPGGKCVLVDYKSFHGGEDLGAIKAHAVQHGYPGQLKAYKDTLESGGCQVQDVLIYYFVLGRVVKFDV